MKLIVRKKAPYTTNSIITGCVISIFLIPNIALANKTQSLNTSLLITQVSSITTPILSEFNQIEIDNIKNSMSNEGIYDQLTPRQGNLDNSIFSDFQNRYLTIHYSKHEKLKAVYEHGAYGVSYQQTW